MTPAPDTFAALLDRRLRGDASAPLVTYYDERSGERVELSTVTYANWVAKAASLLTEEFDLEPGDTILVDLPPHWLTPVFLGAAWRAGLVVLEPASGAHQPAAVVCGPDGLDRWAARADDTVVLACSLLPMAVRFADPLPPGVHDVGIEIWSQPDAFVALDPPSGEDPAVLEDGVEVGQSQWWQRAAAGSAPGGGRLVLAADPASPPSAAAWSEPLLSGSVVLVVGADPARISAIAESERAVVPD